MRANSLALRLFLSATVWTVLILVVTGYVLSGLYRDSVERAVLNLIDNAVKYSGDIKFLAIALRQSAVFYGGAPPDRPLRRVQRRRRGRGST